VTSRSSASAVSRTSRVRNSRRPDATWADYLFNRDNPKGVHYERWLHAYGCGRWFNVARHTVTHEILAVYRMGDPKPVLPASDK
jgi:heterotetrameric sarcosine oxidase delta subunit